MISRESKLLLIAGVILAGFVYLIISMGSVFLPVFVALILAYLFEPLILPLERHGINRTVAIFIIFTGFVLILGGVSAFFIISLRAEFSNIQLNLPDYATRLYNYLPQQLKAILDIETPDKVYNHINSAIENIRGASADLFKETFTFVKKAFASTLSFILAVVGYFITPLYLYYFIKDLPQIRNFVMGLIPLRCHPMVIERGKEIDTILSAFIRGQLSVCAILAVLYSIGLYFIGIDLAIVIGTLAGITFIIPYFGTIIGIVLAVTMAFLKFQDIVHPLLCLGWFGLVQALEGSLITPKIVGDKLGLHPVIIILSLFIGGQLGGILGMLLAMPIAAVSKVFWRSMLAVYRETAFYQGS